MTLPVKAAKMKKVQTLNEQLTVKFSIVLSLAKNHNYIEDTIIADSES